MIIGRFAENPVSGLIIGHIRSLFYKSDKVVFEPLAGGGEKSPTHRIYTGDEVELGCAWRCTAKDGASIYYDVKLDDPTFAAPIQARLVRSKKKDEGLVLLWERATTKRDLLQKAA